MINLKNKNIEHDQYTLKKVFLFLAFTNEMKPLQAIGFSSE
jgi:hypothetical protein